jgi:hypothetical protein
MRSFVFTLGLMILSAPPAGASGGGSAIRCPVTYCTSAQVYFEGGKEDGVSIGDTLTISRGDTIVGEVVITAIATHSSVGRPLPSPLAPRIGDTGTIVKVLAEAPPPAAAADSVRPGPSPPPSPEGGREPEANVLRGRLELQYTGQSNEDSRLNISQPAAYAQVRLENLAGSGLAIALNGREMYDAGGPYLRFGDSAHSRFDLTELSLTFDRPQAFYGFSAGRFISRYVTGVGVLDGGEAFVRAGPFTAGALAGTGIQSRISGIGGNQKTAGGFAGYHYGESWFDAYDASAAYVRQTVDGALDREFLSVQNSIALGTAFNAYAGADVELKEMTQGVLRSHPSISSVLVFVNYIPLPWLSTNFGYDGTRSVYLFESMKGAPDSLFHQALNSGFRFSGTVRLGTNYMVSAEASAGTNTVDGGSSHAMGAGIRIADIFSSRVYLSLRYRGAGGSFLTGSQTTAALGRSFSQTVDLLVQYDSRSYTVDRLKQTYTTQTISGSAYVRVSRHIYWTLGADYIMDNTMNGFQYVLELGYRF